MKLSDYLKKRGAQKALAERLKVPASLVSNWANGVRPVPIERCVDIERATGGDVKRPDLREDWLAIWPELDRRSAPRKPHVTKTA